MTKLALPIILIILGIGSFFWYTQPTYQATDAIQGEIDKYETALSQVNEIQQIRDDLLRQYNQLPRTNLYVMSRVLPERLDTVRMLIELNQIALRHNMTVQDITFTERTDAQQNRSRNNEEDSQPKPYESVKVNFAVTGTYEDVNSFVQDVERSTRLIDIIQFQVGNLEGGSGGGGGEGEVAISFNEEEGEYQSGEDNTYSITGMTYWLPNEDTQ